MVFDPVAGRQQRRFVAGLGRSDRLVEFGVDLGGQGVGQRVEGFRCGLFRSENRKFQFAADLFQFAVDLRYGLHVGLQFDA